MNRCVQPVKQDSKKRRFWVAGLALVSLLSCCAYAKKHKDATGQLEQEKRAIHALDRLTFGPRPGDVQRLASGDIGKWIELQLHPQEIDDSSMQARLAEYRTLRMSSHDLVVEFPPNNVAKAVQDGKLPMPGDAYGHAVYVAAIDRLQQKQDKKQEASYASQSASSNMAAGASSPPLVKASQMHSRQDRHEARGAIDELAELSPDARMQRILSLPVDVQRDLTQGSVPLAKRQALLAGLSPLQKETVLALNNPQAVVDSELQSAKLLRAVYSDRQLEEVLTDFWFNHFNIFVGKGADRYLVTAYERDAIRPHVLGKFKELLTATAKSPAMLFYLDNWQSEGPNSAAVTRPDGAAKTAITRRAGWPKEARSDPHPPTNNQQQKRRSGLNENYARELMELQTLGVNGGYTQHDVTEVARVFTGWTLSEPREGGGYVFRPRLHDPGKKIVLGHTIKENGEKEGLQVLDLLANQPATARFISTELAQRFVSDNPPASLVDAMSKTFLKTDGDLREVMRAMFRSQEFWAPETYDARVKTPLEFVASALRATETDIADPQPLLATLNKMGMPLYGMQPPTGYSTKADVWVNSAALLDRMNFGLALSTNRLPGLTFDVAKMGLAARGDETNGDIYRTQSQLEQVLLSGQVSKSTHDAIEHQVVSPSAPLPGATPAHGANVNVVAGLLLGSPEFQRK